MSDRVFNRMVADAINSGFLGSPNLRGFARAQRADAATVNFAYDFRARITRVFREKLQECKALDFVPLVDVAMDLSHDGFVGTYLTGSGEAGFVEETSGDIPVVTVSGKPFMGRVARYGAKARWSHLDIARASLGAVNVPMETAARCREAIERKTDALVSLGDTSRGIPGFLKHPDVSVVPLSVGSWGSGTTFDTVVGDVIAWVGAQRNRVKYVESSVPDTLAIPGEVHTYLTQKRQPNTGVSAFKVICDELTERFPGAPVTVALWSRLSSAGLSGGPRMVLYRRSPEIVGAVVPVVFQEFPAQMRDFHIEIPALGVCGGTYVFEPSAIAYADNALA